MKEVRFMKQSIRQQYKTIRRQIPLLSRQEQQQNAISHLCQSSLWQESQNILLYLALADEFSLDDLFPTGWQAGKNLYIPLSIAENHTLLISKLEKFSDLIIGAYGIRELPQNHYQLIAPQVLDLVIIPGIAFDLFGSRIGFGAGYYDRFLPKLKKQTPKIGAAYTEQISTLPLPNDPFDIPIDYLLTGENLINLKQLSNKQV